MIAIILFLIAASPLARVALRYGATALAIILFLLSIRRTGERAGRLAGRLETMEKTHGVQRRMLNAAARRPRDRDELVELQASKFRISCNPAKWLLFIELPLATSRHRIVILFVTSALRGEEAATCFRRRQNKSHKPVM